MKKLDQFLHDQSGVTFLETAIISSAFVIVVTVFIFTMLVTGTFLTERSQKAALAGGAQVCDSMQVRGNVILAAAAVSKKIPATGCDGDDTNHPVAKTISFTLSNSVGGTPIDLTDTVGKQVTTLTYRDQYQTYDLNAASGAAIWTVSWLGKNNGDDMLEAGELAEITVDLSRVTGMDTTCPLGPGRTFAIEIKPPNGVLLSIQRTTPTRIDAIMDLTSY